MANIIGVITSVCLCVPIKSTINAASHWDNFYYLKNCLTITVAQHKADSGSQSDYLKLMEKISIIRLVMPTPVRLTVYLASVLLDPNSSSYTNEQESLIVVACTSVWCFNWDSCSQQIGISWY